MSADDAYASARQGELLIVDVRSPAEWRETGVPEGAAPVTIHNRGGPMAFLEEMLAAVDGDKNRPIATICAQGVRSAAAARFLREQGFTKVQDISEGMLGREGQPGWLARGLPVEACQSC